VKQTTGRYAALRSGAVLRPVVEVTAWIDGQYVTTLTGDRDLIGGTITDQDGQNPRGTLELHATRSAAAAIHDRGMTLTVRKGLRGAAGDVAEWVPMGTFMVEYLEPPIGGVVAIHGRGPGWAVDLAKFTAATTLPAATFSAHVTQLTAGIVPVVFDARLVNRSAPARTWDEDRQAALLEVLDAWPATIGGSLDVLTIRPPWSVDSTAPVGNYVSGESGTLTALAPRPDAQGTPNAVVCWATDNTSLRATAYITSGDLRWNGPYGRRPIRFASPLLTTQTAVNNAARTRLWSAQTRQHTVEAEILPDDLLEVGDVVRVAHDDTDAVGRILEITHPLTRADGNTRVVLAVLSGLVAGVDIGLAPTLKIDVEGAAQPATSSGSTVATTPPPPKTTSGTSTVAPQSTGSWRAGSWRGDTTVLYQGDWTGRGIQEGAAYYGSGLSGVPGSITSATVRLVRQDGAGYTSAQIPTMTLLAGGSRGGAPSRLATAPGPALETGQSTDWPVPSSWLASMNNGSAGGIGCYVGSTSPYVGLTPAAGGMTVTARWTN